MCSWRLSTHGEWWDFQRLRDNKWAMKFGIEARMILALWCVAQFVVGEPFDFDVFEWLRKLAG